MQDASDPVVARVRAREYPGPRAGIFLNAASWGLVPRSSAEASAGLTLGRNRVDGFEEVELGAIQRRCRRALAGLLDVDASEIVLAPNTSFGVSLAAALLREGEPGAVLVSEGEFPANVLPFMALEAHGFEVRLIPSDGEGFPDEDRILEEVEAADVRALAVSAVQFGSGHRANLARLGEACRRCGVYFFVDAIQLVGAGPLRPHEVSADIVACGGQKWLCAPWGSGFTWIRKAIQARFAPPMVSWLAIKGGADFGEMGHYRLDWRADGRKFELATLGIQDYLGLAVSVEVLAEIGLERVRAHLSALHEPVLRWIRSTQGVKLRTPVDPEHRAGILAFTPPDVDGVAARLAEGGVVFSVREGAIRLAPHFYNTLEEMEATVRLLEAGS